MSDTIINFASDNATGAAPEVIEAVTKASEGYAMPYGNDPWTERVVEQVSELFEKDVAAYPIATGTSANSTALACLSKPWGVIYCHDLAHIHNDECGAPEFYSGGAKLLGLPGEDAKFSPGDLDALISGGGAGGVHHAQPAAVSITQATERGGVYTADQVAELSAVAHKHDLPVHMDGARFANAIVASGSSPAEMTWKAGVDVLSFGATKNGAFAAEVVVFFDKDLAEEFELRRKRAGHLFSKMRFVSAQLNAYFENENWRRFAAAANKAATGIADGLANLPGISVTNSVEANILFADISAPVHKSLQDAGFQYYAMNEGADGGVSIRLVTGFNTTDAHVDRFVNAARTGAGLSAAE